MLTTLQHAFEERLEKQAAARQLEVVAEYTYANVGRYHFKNPGTLHVYASVPFSWQTGSVYLGQTRDGPNLFPDRPNPQYAGFKADQLEEALGALMRFAAERKEESL